MLSDIPSKGISFGSLCPGEGSPDLVSPIPQSVSRFSKLSFLRKGGRTSDRVGGEGAGKEGFWSNGAP